MVRFKLIIIAWLVVHADQNCAGEARVAAAASLTFAAAELSRVFERNSLHKAKITIGSSFNLMRQIEQGAPFEVFLSADEIAVQELYSKSLTTGRGVIYAIGTLVLFRANFSKLPLDSRLDNLIHWIRTKQLKHLAIANPETAPYGVIAKHALQKVGVWELSKPLLVLGDNAAQTAQFGLSSADAALIPYALALRPTFANRGSYIPISKHLYNPLYHQMVLLKGRGDAAVAFYQFLQGPIARDILESHGFGVPD